MTSFSSPPAESLLEDRVDAYQRLIAWGAVVGSIMLALQHILIEAHFKGGLPTAVILASTAGWMVFLYATWQTRRLLASPEGTAYAAQISGDERLLSFRTEAFTYGFAAMLIVQVLLIVLWTGFGESVDHILSIPVAATVTMAAGISAAVLRYQNRSNK
jgi:hypothetical protein